MNNATYLLPAYGRTYASRLEAIADWHAGKDFLCNFGGYCSIRDQGYLTQFGANIYFKIGTEWEKL
jgi:hypothetical protein